MVEKLTKNSNIIIFQLERMIYGKTLKNLSQGQKNTSVVRVPYQIDMEEFSTDTNTVIHYRLVSWISHLGDCTLGVSRNGHFVCQYLDWKNTTTYMMNDAVIYGPTDNSISEAKFNPTGFFDCSDCRLLVYEVYVPEPATPPNVTAAVNKVSEEAVVKKAAAEALAQNLAMEVAAKKARDTEQARLATQELARAEAEARAQQEAKEQARREALEQARLAALQLARVEAMEQTALAAAEQARQVAAEQAINAAKEVARQQAETASRLAVFEYGNVVYALSLKYVFFLYITAAFAVLHF